MQYFVIKWVICGVWNKMWTIKSHNRYQEGMNGHGNFSGQP